MFPIFQRVARVLLFVVIFILLPAVYLVRGDLPAVVQRAGILFQIFGVALALPDLIGASQLRRWAHELSTYQRSRGYLQAYLARANRSAGRGGDVALLHLFLSLSGSYLVNAVFLLIWANVLLLKIDPLALYFVILAFFTFLASMAGCWYALLLLLFVRPDLARTYPVLLELFLQLNAVADIFGVWITALFALLLDLLLAILCLFANIPLRRTLLWVIIPLLLLGAALQFAATYF